MKTVKPIDKITFTDEITFYVNGIVKKPNTQFCQFPQATPDAKEPFTKTARSQELVWLSWESNIIPAPAIIFLNAVYTRCIDRK